MHALTGVPQGLIACAHGGTRMDQWSPRLKRAGGHSLYGAMLRRHHRNGGHIAGLLWHQGESDAGLRSMLTYAGKMRAFVRAVRRDFGNPVLPIVVAQLGRFAGPQEQPVAWNTIREIQRRLPEQFPRLAVVPTIDLRMCDPVHLSGEAQHQLGQRLAGAMFALRGRRAGSASIALRSVRVRVPSSVSQATVEVAFTHVVGGLQSAVRPAGFSLYDADQLYAVIHDVELAGGVVRLRTCRPAADLIGKTLYYGAGLDPVCTITDGAGRPLPAMGPLTLHAGRSA